MILPYVLGSILLASASLTWWWRFRELRGTTLGAPWCWTGLSLATVVLVELLAHRFGETGAPWVQPLRFAAAAGLSCRTISLLGAKRPQDGAWNFVVLTLWGVLALPSLEVALLGRGQDLQIQDVRAWFLWILIGLELSHHLGTRCWPVSVLWAAGQTLLLASYLPLVRWEAPPWVRLAAILLLVASMVHQLRRLPRRPPSWDRLWLDFRDSFGVAWSLRVMERINAAAELYQWPLRLRWHGFVSHETPSDSDPPSPSSFTVPAPDVAASLEQTTRNLLRRFVSDDWISARMPALGPSDSPRGEDESEYE